MSPGDVVHEWSLWRTVLATALIGLIGALIGGAVPALLRGETPYSDLDGLSFVLVFVVVFVAGSVFLDRREPPRMRFTPDGIEFFGARRDGVFVPWAVDPTVRVRWFWPFTALGLTASAADAAQVVRLPRGGRAPAMRRRRDGTLSISMPLYGLAVSARTVRARFSAAARSGRPESQR